MTVWLLSMVFGVSQGVMVAGYGSRYGRGVMVLFMGIRKALNNSGMLIWACILFSMFFEPQQHTNM